MEIFPIPALKDNYIWCIADSKSRRCVVVDPGESAPVFRVLQERMLTLDAILLTHHHWDHTAGVSDLVSQFSVPVYGAGHKTDPVISVLDCLKFKAISIPGHTLDHTAYYDGRILFTGDTLFAGGCGRVFEGTMPQMFSSLMQLKSLPDATEVYCGHEYTVKNLQFALLVEPSNKTLLSRLAQAKQLRQMNQPTLPSTIGLEKLTNPFLRTDQATVIEAVQVHSGRSVSQSEEVFSILRAWKDSW